MLLITYERKWLKSLLNEGFSLFFLFICGIIKIMNYRDYIWDLGGTLLDNYETSTNAFVATLKDFQIQADHDSVYAALKVSTQNAIETYAPHIPNFRSEYKKKEALGLQNPILFEGAKELLQEIQSHGGRHFLVSHRDRQVLTLLDQTGIAPFFTEIVTADEGFPRKPDPASMLYLKEKYQIQNGLVIGDRPIDIEAGKAAGLATYLFDSMQALHQFIFD